MPSSDPFQGVALEPTARATGPFATPAFLARVAAFAGDTFDLHHDGDAAIAVTATDGRLLLAGDPELTDYHSPFGPPEAVSGLVGEIAGTLEPGTEIDFDSLPEEAAGPLVAGLEAAGLEPKAERHAVSAVVRLPETWDDYLQAIGKKQRHEVRRKRRRYEDEVGELLHETHDVAGWAFDEFIRLHRHSAGAKGRFMDEPHEAFFRELIGLEGWRIDVLRVPGTDRASAALFSYVDEEGMYLYNSAYDLELSEASPGVAIIGSMIEQAIEEGLPRFDFLKGDEVYKFRLGADERPLMRVRAVV